MISQNDLRWFIEISERKHMTRASERLGISQPALSHWLKNLEIKLGSPLFVRSRQGMELTKFGEKLKQKSTHFLQTWDDFIQEIQTDEDELRARFSFGVHESVALFTLPKIFKLLSNSAPGIQLNLSHGLSRHMLEDVISKRLDLALVVNPTPHPDLIIKELYRDHVQVFSLKSKVKNRLIYNPSILQSNELLNKIKDLPQDKIETSSLEVAAHLAMAGEGMAILPQRVAEALAPKKLFPLYPMSVIDKHCLVYRPKMRETKAGIALLDTIKSALS